MNSSSVGATTFVFGVALLARVLLLWWDSQEWLGRRIEISTPVNQWMRGTYRPSLSSVQQLRTVLSEVGERYGVS